MWVIAQDDKGRDKFIPQPCTVKELKANLDASWNCEGNKFAVGSSSGMVRQCTWNSTVNMWIAAEEKQRHTDSVTCVRYDPGSGRALASCAMDGIV